MQNNKVVDQERIDDNKIKSIMNNEELLTKLIDTFLKHQANSKNDEVSAETIADFCNVLYNCKIKLNTPEINLLLTSIKNAIEFIKENPKAEPPLKEEELYNVAGGFTIDQETMIDQMLIIAMRLIKNYPKIKQAYNNSMPSSLSST